MNEIWKDIKGYEGLYQVSNTGKVISILSRRERKVSVKDNGYGYLPLVKYKIHTKFQIHRLVAEHFIPNSENKPEVNHKDGNKLNNCADNLEWVTHKENIAHAHREGLMSNEYKRTPVIAVNMKSGLILNFDSQTIASEKMRIRQGDIANVISGNQKTTKGYRFFKM